MPPAWVWSRPTAPSMPGASRRRARPWETRCSRMPTRPRGHQDTGAEYGILRTTVRPHGPRLAATAAAMRRSTGREATMLTALVFGGTAHYTGPRAATLARRFERANDDLMAAVERCPEA